MTDTETGNKDDIRPFITVWLPTAIAAYAIVFKLSEWILNSNGFHHRIPVEICGGGSCDTVQMMASGYYAGLFGITAMLLIFGVWFVRSELRHGSSSSDNQ